MVCNNRRAAFQAASRPLSRTASRGATIARMNAPLDTAIAVDVYRQRRERVLAALRAAGGGVAIVPTAPEVPRNRDTDYPYRFDSYFHYLTGFSEPDAVLVLNAAARRAGVDPVLPRQERRPRNLGRLPLQPEAARDAFGFDAAFAVDVIDTEMPRLLADAGTVHYRFGASADFERRLAGWVDAVRALARTGVAAPDAMLDLTPLLDDMRLVKDEHEPRS